MSLAWIVETIMGMGGMSQESDSMPSSLDDAKGGSKGIAALCTQQLMAPFTVEGTCNRDVFETWLSTCLVPVLKPGQVVTMDNATFHKGGRIEQLIREAGCEVLYLPPYSPDLNRIEKCWSWLKSRIRKQLDQFDTLRETMEHVLRLAS